MPLRRLVIVAVVLVAVLSGPVAMAFGGCAAMAAACDSPCGLVSDDTPLPTGVPRTLLVSYLTTLPPDDALSIVLAVPELPPKSLHLSA